MQDRTTTIYELAQKAASAIQSVVPDELKRPRFGIICGSGLGGLVGTLDASPQFAIPYSEIPEFPQSAGCCLNSPSWPFLTDRPLASRRACRQAGLWIPWGEEDPCCCDGWAGTVCSLSFEQQQHVINKPSSFYEGHSVEKAAFPTRVMKVLGVSSLIVTNAAGGLNPEYRVGDIMILNDVQLPGVPPNTYSLTLVFST